MLFSIVKILTGDFMKNNTVRFRSSCIKTLSPVEASAERSHQHEFNGVKELKNLLGTKGFQCNATFSIRGTHISSIATVTWYDAREAHPSRSEYRLYFYSNKVMENAEKGDNIIIGFDTSSNLQIILIKSGTSSHQGYINKWESIK